HILSRLRGWMSSAVWLMQPCGGRRDTLAQCGDTIIADYRPFRTPPTRDEQGRLRGVQVVGPVLRQSVPPSCHAWGVARLRVGARRPGWQREALSMPGAPRRCASLVLLPGACAFAERSMAR